MSNIISVTDFRNHVSEIVNRVHYKNETIFLMRGATVVAKITGVAPSYPYARQIKAARVKANGFMQAVIGDFVKLLTHMVKIIAAGVKFVSQKTWGIILLIIEGIKRWVGICLAVEKESWFGSSTAFTKRRMS